MAHLVANKMVSYRGHSIFKRYIPSCSHFRTCYLISAVLILIAIPIFFVIAPLQAPFQIPALQTRPPLPGDNLPTLLGIQSYTQNLQKTPPPPPPPQPVDELVKKYPTSLLGLYHSVPSVCARQPFRPHLHTALTQYAAKYSSYLSREYPVPDESSLIIHLVSRHPAPRRATSISDLFINQTVSIASNFSSVIILPFAEAGATPASFRKDVELVSAKLHRSGRKLLVRKSVGIDDDVYFMWRAKNLLVHRGPLSALAALVCQGVVYHTPELSRYTDRNAFRWLLNDARPAGPDNRSRSRLMLDGMGVVEPTCCRFDAYGTGDGEKIMCGNTKTLSRKGDEGCWVLSVGCGGRFHFEDAVVKRSKCHVHTFDCTGNWSVPKRLAGRVSLHKFCLGTEGDTQKGFIGWRQVLDIGEKESGYPVPRFPATVKMDIEGWEMPVLNELFARDDRSLLPEQIAMEVHLGGLKRVGTRTKETMAQFFRNMSNVGYVLAHRADNPYCESCSEVTVVHRDALPAE